MIRPSVGLEQPVLVWRRDRPQLLREVLSQAQGCWVQSSSSPNQRTHQTWSTSPQGGFRPEKGPPRARVSASLLSPACRVEVWEAPRRDQLRAGQFQERKGSVCGHPDIPSPSAAAGTEPGLPCLGWSRRRVPEGGHGGAATTSLRFFLFSEPLPALR